MTYTLEQLEAAAEVYATRMHEGQLDKAGQPYIEHLRRVAERMPTPELRIVAWLHDILEDTYTSLAQIKDAFGPEIGAAVDAITRLSYVALEDVKRQRKYNRALTYLLLIDGQNKGQKPEVSDGQ